jgi:hypothetical protein
MVISVFPNYGSGFQAFERARGNRLQAEAARTEMDLRERQRQAYNRMLQGVPQDQRPMYEVLGPEQGTAMMLQGRQAEAEREAERRRAANEYGGNVATRFRALSGQEGFDPDRFFQQAYSYGQQEYGLQMPYEQFVQRVQNPMAGEIPESGVNFERFTAINPDTDREEIASFDPRTRQVEFLGIAPPPRSAGVQVNVGPGGQAIPPGEVSSTEALSSVIDLEGIFDAADRAPGELRRIEAAREALNDPDLRTGFGGEIRTQLGSLALTLGASDEWVSENIQAVGPAENFRAVQNIAALALRNPDSGFGLTGNTSNRDVQFLLAAVPGLNNTREANELLLDIMEQRVRVQQGAAEIAMRHMEGGSYNPLELRRDLSRYYASDEVTNAASEFRRRAEDQLRRGYGLTEDQWSQLSEAERSNPAFLRALGGQ